MVLNGVKWMHGRISSYDERLAWKNLINGLAQKNFIHIFYLEHLGHTFGGPWLSKPFSMSHEDDYFYCCLSFFQKLSPEVLQVITPVVRLGQGCIYISKYNIYTVVQMFSGSLLVKMAISDYVDKVSIFKLYCLSVISILLYYVVYN